jgi:hypothetical protein
VNQDNVVPSSPTLVILMMMALSSSETSVLTGVTQRIPEDAILQTVHVFNIVCRSLHIKDGIGPQISFVFGSPFTIISSLDAVKAELLSASLDGKETRDNKLKLLFPLAMELVGNNNNL